MVVPSGTITSTPTAASTGEDEFSEPSERAELFVATENSLISENDHGEPVCFRKRGSFHDAYHVSGNDNPT